MKDTDIHEGLKEQEIRDFLSQELVRLLENSLDNKYNNEIRALNEEFYSTPEADRDYFTHMRGEKLLQIKKLQSELKAIDSKYALLSLIKSKGWEEHDVSDYTTRTGSKFHMNLIGTEDEYKILMEKLKK